MSIIKTEKTNFSTSVQVLIVTTTALDSLEARVGDVERTAKEEGS